MSELDPKLRAVGAMWGRADYERIAVRLAPNGTVRVPREYLLVLGRRR